MTKTTHVFRPVESYNLHKTCDFGSFSRAKYSTDIYCGGAYKRVLQCKPESKLVSVSQPQPTHLNHIEITIEGEKSTESSIKHCITQISRMIGADQDPSGFYLMAESDSFLNPLVDKFYGLHIPQTASVFEGLVLAILGQQISTHVAGILRSLIVERYGSILSVGDETYHSFPSPQSLELAGVKELHANKFSRRKAEYLCEISALESKGTIHLENLRNLAIEDAVNMLTSLRGVGQWTAQWLLIRSLGYEDGFPSGDLALQKILGDYFNGGEIMSEREIMEFSARWRPYRSWVTTYIFAGLRCGVFSVASK